MNITYAKIYMDNFSSNIHTAKGFITADTKLCVCIKADAYGHGAIECAKAAIMAGASYLAVARVAEGRVLRQAGIEVPILVLSLCSPEEMPLLVQLNLTPLVFDEDYIKLLDDVAVRQGKKEDTPLDVHLAVDTGMGRIGCVPSKAARVAYLIRDTRALHLSGVCTHFACSDSLKQEDIAYTKEQYNRFCHAISHIQDAGLSCGIRHCCNSAAIFNNSEYHMDMVRLGIAAYGYYPGDITWEYLAEHGKICKLKPCMALCTRVSSIRPFTKGMSVSYCHEWTATKDTQIAVLPIGYADGLLRRYASVLKVGIEGRAYSICGRICMDQCMIDIGQSNIDRFQEAILFGPKEYGAIMDAQDIADATDTIPYEVTCAVAHSRVPRIFV